MQTRTSSLFGSFLFTGVVAFVSATAACSVATSSTSEPTGQAAEAQAIGGGGVGSGAWCDGSGLCTCTGDEDCNNMFSSGVCGEKAICQIDSADVPRCRCVVAAVKPTNPLHPIGIVNPVPPIFSQK
jgi:hypothetical protein